MALVRINPHLEAELTGSPSNRGQMEHVLGDVADRIAMEGRRIAGAEFYRRGGYQRGIHAEHGVNEHGEVVGRVVATDWKSHWGEWPPRQERGRRQGRILSRAAERVGYEVLAASLVSSGRPGARAIGGRPRAAITGR